MTKSKAIKTKYVGDERMKLVDLILRICYLYREHDALREKGESMLRMNGGVATPIFEVEKEIAEETLKKLENDIQDFVSRIKDFDFPEK